MGQRKLEGIGWGRWEMEGKELDTMKIGSGIGKSRMGERGKDWA